MNTDSKTESSFRERLTRETREVILQAAEALFAERGLQGARMEDIAARAGVAVGTIYNHVGDRNSLIGELFSQRRLELVQRLDEVLRASEGWALEEQLMAFVDAVFEHFETHLGLFRIAVQEESGPPQRPKGAVLALLTERARTLVRRGVDQGLLREDATQLCATLLMGMMRGVFLHALEVDLDLGAAAREVVRVFMHGTAKP